MSLERHRLEQLPRPRWSSRHEGAVLGAEASPTCELAETFRSLFGGEPLLFRAPGRVNLIGEHTDYNEGFVMPAAVDLYTWAAAAARDDRRLRVRSENFREAVEFELDEGKPQPRGHWSDYVRGVAVTLGRAGHLLRGANLLIRSEVPAGAGLASSAAVEVAAALALLGVSGAEVGRMELARLCQRAENEFVGVRCGLMDQFISFFGEAGRALLLDCRTLAHDPAHIPADLRLVVCNTMVRHELAAGEYNARREACEEGVRLLSRALPHVRTLRDVSAEDLDRHGGRLPRVVHRRCRHVVTENARVLLAHDALGRGDAGEFGRLMRESHRSLREDYEVSCPELDLMVELAESAEGVCGARMTGGGFGGSTVTLVRADGVDAFRQSVADGYERATGRRPEIYVCSPAAGAGRVDEEAEGRGL